MDQPQLNFIGYITTPYQQLQDCPREPQPTGQNSILTINHEYQLGLQGIEETEFLQVLYWFDQADRSQLLRSHKFDHERYRRGVFVSRSPMRPNPVAVSVVKIINVKDNTITVTGLDCLDGTPIVDIKSFNDQYNAYTHLIPKDSTDI